MLTRFWKLVKYNRDWPSYILGKFRSPKGGELLTFRLRNGQTVRLKPEVRFVLNEIYLDNAYDVPGVDLRACRSILDLGANVGIFTLYVSHLAPQAKIFCFEPSTLNFGILQDNIKTNAVRATPYRMALDSHSGRGHLSIAKKSAEYSLGAAGAKTEEVDCVDLRTIYELTGVEMFDFVKMDIEGAEREVLNQCPDDLLRRIKALSLEWHHSIEELDRLAQRLRSLGFVAERQILPVNVRYLKAWQPGTIAAPSSAV